MNRFTVRIGLAATFAALAVLVGWQVMKGRLESDTPVPPTEVSERSESVETTGNGDERFLVTGEDPIQGRVGAGLNTADGTAQQDLVILDSIFAAWRSNSGGKGNPVGTNREITAALIGRNAWGFAIIPPDHPAINAQGELCDRWGAPLFFHQLSGDQMEIRSSGPDRQRYTDDDVVLAP